MLLSKAFRSEVQAQQNRGLTSTDSPDAISPAVNEVRSFPTLQNAKRSAKQVQSKGENRTS